MTGLIPAHAGKTRAHWDQAPAGPAHPRSRGENASGPFWRRFPWGSSPLTRGKRRRAHLLDRVPGLIPAHAGKTQTLSPTMFISRAHPRSRGENRVALTQLANAGGSSPLTRGKHGGHGLADADRGLIPAHAGKTMRPDVTPRGHRAHPRSRGENVNGAGAAAFSSGSSPLTRGKLSEEVGCPPY